MPAGSFTALGTESNGMSGVPWANSASGADSKNARTSANFFILISSILQLCLQSWAVLYAERAKGSAEPGNLWSMIYSTILQGCELRENISFRVANANGIYSPCMKERRARKSRRE